MFLCFFFEYSMISSSCMLERCFVFPLELLPPSPPLFHGFYSTPSFNISSQRFLNFPFYCCLDSITCCVLHRHHRQRRLKAASCFSLRATCGPHMYQGPHSVTTSTLLFLPLSFFYHPRILTTAQAHTAVLVSVSVYQMLCSL